ncbi:MAG: ATP-binding protein [Deltaproteobacteria bacterium]|nr:MAG: ATP-binding protein [Deltaproteobacteria bacterium]
MNKADARKPLVAVCALDTDSACVERLLAFVREQAAGAGLPKLSVERVALALTELFANIGRHAYRGEPGRIELSSWLDEDAGLLVFEVRDWAPVRWEENTARIDRVCPRTGTVAAGGLGMRLIHSVSERCEHRSLTDGNLWRLEFAARPDTGD